MASPRDTWRSLPHATKALAVVIPAVVVASLAVVVALAVPALPPPAAKPTPGPTDAALPPLPSPSLPPEATPVPTPTPGPPGADTVLGSDGRLTILLLGSDYRPAHPGNRTDAIMVVSVDPASGKAAAFSIPRDAVQFPLPGGRVYGAKVNALYQQLLSTTKDGSGAMKNAVAKAFNIEVDSYVFIGFDGVKRLVTAVGGVDVTLDRAYFDPEYWVNRHHRGWGLPAGRSHLGGNDALIFARSRKGDNDFGRARRQQMLVMAALEKVRSLGPAQLPHLLSIASRTVRTDLPVAQAVRVFDIVSQANLRSAQRTVFGPRTFATGRGGTAFALNIAACRAWIAKYFPPVRKLGTWPVVSADAGASSGASPATPAP